MSSTGLFETAELCVNVGEQVITARRTQHEPKRASIVVSKDDFMLRPPEPLKQHFEADFEAPRTVGELANEQRAFLQSLSSDEIKNVELPEIE